MTYRRSFRRAGAAATLAFTAAACHRGSTGAGDSGTVVAAASGASSAVRAPMAPRMPAGVTAASIALADSIFHAHTGARCHGKGGVGGQNGPPLVKSVESPWLHGAGTYEQIVATIISGVPKDSLRDKTRRFQMNPRGSNPPINDDEVKAVAAYIWKLNYP